MTEQTIKNPTLHRPVASFNFKIIWKRRRFTIRLGLYFALGTFITFVIVPWKTSYEAMLRIEPELSTTGELTSIEAEMDVMQSWGTVSEAVRKMHRNVTVASAHSNLWLHLGYYLNYIANGFSSNTTPSFAVYQPSLQLTYFDITPNADGFIGRPFLLEVTKEGYLLYSPDDQVSKGNVGQMLEITDKNSKKHVKFLINNINATEGARFVITPSDFDSFAKNIQNALKVDRRGFRDRSGLMTVEFSDVDPIFSQQLLSALVDTYLAQAYDRSSLGKIHGLEKLREKSESLKADLENSQKQLAEFKDSNKIVSLAQDQDAGYKRSMAIEEELRKVTAEYKDNAATLTDKHPVMVSLSNRIAYLKQQLDSLKSDLTTIPQKEKEQSILENNIIMARAMLDENTSTMAKLYSEVETITGYAHVVSLNSSEKATPLLRGILAVIAGFLTGAVIAFSWLIKQMAPAFARIRYEEDLLAISALPVVSRLPFRWSGVQWLWYQKRANAVKSDAEWYEKSIAEIATLEKAVTYLLPSVTRPILLFSSVCDTEGSSFCALQTAIASAKIHKTLLIDAHILRPLLHESIGTHPTPGLTDVLVGQAALADAIKQTGSRNLFFLPAGTQTHNYRLISEKDRVQHLLSELSHNFERIVIAFPIANPVICQQGVLELADAVFMVVRRDTPARKVESTLRSCGIENLKASFLILNKG